MKIGIMLRHYEQHGGGVKVYTQNLMREMLQLNTSHEFNLIYANPKLIGTYSHIDNVRESAIRAPSVFLWDQVAIRYIEKREKLDLIFNPKYSIPLTAKCKTVYVSHGLNWAVLSLQKPWYDHVSHRFLRPRYAKKADAIIAVSNTTRQNIIDYFKIPSDRIHTVYHGVDEAFRKIIKSKKLEEIRHNFSLPEKYFLYVGQIYPPKNFGRLLEAYSRVGPELGLSLVIAGEHRLFCKNELALIDRLGISSYIHWPGWVDRETLPSFYALSEALILPSLYESFGLPILEAMTVGTPVVTSNIWGTKEVTNGAGILVDPENVDSIADGMRQAVVNLSLRKRIVEAGRKRAINFTWKKCATDTMKVLESVMMK